MSQPTQIVPCLAVALAVTLATQAHAADDSPRPILPEDTLPEKIEIDTVRARLKPFDVLPKDNPLTSERVALGRKLFFDPILSKDRQVSCASCHQPNHGFASPDPKAIGIGGQIGRRNAPTLLNRAVGKHQFWDGRVTSLEEQALHPIENAIELGNSMENLMADLRRDSEYVASFETAFATDGDKPTKVTPENLAKALAAFQRTLLQYDSPVDRFQTGKYDELTQKERQGLWIFESRGRCWKCHTGDNYSDEAFHNTGIGFGRKDRDLGRFEVTEIDSDRGKFKTPTLRSLTKTAPYMHDGSLESLSEVVDFYNNGGDPSDPHLDQNIEPLGLSPKEVSQLVAFLESLSR